MSWKILKRYFAENILNIYLDVGAGGDQGTAGQFLVKGGVLPPVQLVDGDLPERPGLFRTVPVAGVGDPAVTYIQAGLSSVGL